MERGLYIAASGMMANQVRLDVTSNNLANASTTGYKGDRVATRSFAEMLVRNLKDGTTVGGLSLGAQVQGVRTAFDQGALVATERPLDLAITGNGFFAVQTPRGERYTRDGSFQRSADGYLVTAAGDRVLGADGPVRIPAGEFTVGPDGTISSGGGTAGRLRIVALADPAKEGAGLLTGEARDAADATVQQGFREAANVNTVTEMVAMIEVMRSFESGQKVIHAIDETLQRAANDVGRVG